jgi:hypothetical protein
VIEALECPSTSETVFGWAPFVSRSVGQVCLSSWNLVCGSLEPF